MWLAARDPESGEAAGRSVSSEQPDADVRFVPLDVTSDASVRAAYDVVAAAGGLDVLVNNAGVTGNAYDTVATTPADFLPVYAVNVLGPVRMTHVFAPLLTASLRPRLVMVSSGLSTVAFNNGKSRDESGVPGMVYQPSKAALNMIANQYAKALPDVRVASVDPGYTATEPNGHSGPQTVKEGTDAIVAAASADEIPGRHFDRLGAIPREPDQAGGLVVGRQISTPQPHNCWNATSPEPIRTVTTQQLWGADLTDHPTDHPTGPARPRIR